MHPLEPILIANRVDFKRSDQHHHVREGWLGLDCQWCGKGSFSYHLGISSSLGCRCWRCGKKSIAAVWEALRLPKDGWKQLRKQSPIFTPEQPTGTLQLPKHLGPLLTPHKHWLKSRGFRPNALAALWGLQATNHRGGRLAWRLVAPIRLFDETVSWTSRRVQDKGPSKRWISASPEEEQIPLKSLVYGLDLVEHACVICEGPSDCWKIGPGAVACLGLGGISQSQLLALSQIPVRVVLFDDEPQAQIEAAKLAAQLSEFPGDTIRVELEDGKSGADPGSCSRKQVQQIRDAFLPRCSLDWLSS